MSRIPLKSLAFLLVFSLACPARSAPTSALRTGQAVQNHEKSGLEQSLHSAPVPEKSSESGGLIEKIKHSNTNVLINVAVRIREMGPKALPLIPALLFRLGGTTNSRLKSILRNMLDSLDRLGEPAVIYFSQEFYKTESPQSRAAAAEYVPTRDLCAALLDQWSAVRVAAAEELGRRTAFEAWADLSASVAEDESERVRLAAKIALRKLEETLAHLNEKGHLPAGGDWRALTPRQLEAAALLADPRFERMTAPDQFSTTVLKNILKEDSMRDMSRVLERIEQILATAHEEDNDVLFLRRFSVLLQSGKQTGKRAAGLEGLAPWERFQRETEAIERKIEMRGDIETTLTAGEIWTLTQIADENGNIILVPLDQENLSRWIGPLDESLKEFDPDQVYRLGIAVGLDREVREMKGWPRRPSRNACFLFSHSIVRSADFRRLRSDKRTPKQLQGLLGEGMHLRDVRFFVQGENPAVERWKPPQPGITVQEAILLGAIGIKDNLMLGVEVDEAERKGRKYHPYWKQLEWSNGRFVEQRLEAIRSVTGGKGIGYIAGAILWAVPPADFVPYLELQEMERTLEEWRADYALDTPTWALEAQAREWMESQQKQDLEESPKFARAHQQMTEKIIEKWSATRGITLIMLAGPYFVQTPKQWDERREQAATAIRRLAKINEDHEGRAKGKILPYTRSRDWEVYYGEWKEMAKAGLTPGIVAGISFLSKLLDRNQKFHPLDGNEMKNAVRRGAVRLLQGIDFLQENYAPGVWSAYDISPFQVRQIRDALSPNHVASGLETTMSELANAVGHAIRDHRPLQVRVERVQKHPEGAILQVRTAHDEVLQVLVRADQMLRNGAGHLSPKARLDWLLGLNGSEQRIIPRSVHGQLGPDQEGYIEAVFDVSQQGVVHDLQARMRFLTSRLDAGERVPVRVVHVDPHANGMEFIYEEGDHVVRGFIPTGRITGWTSQHGPVLQMAWQQLMLVRKTPVFISGGYALRVSSHWPSLICSATVPEDDGLREQLQAGYRKLQGYRDDGKPARAWLVGVNKGAGVGDVLYEEESSWMPGVVSASVLSRRGNLRYETVVEALDHLVGQRLEMAPEEFHEDEARIHTASFVFQLPEGEILRKIGSVIAELRQARSRLRTVDVELVSVLEGGWLMAYTGKNDWRRKALLPWRFLPDFAATREEKMQHSERWIGSRMKVFVKKVEQQEDEPHVIFSMTPELWEINGIAPSGLEEGLRSAIEVDASS